jgi:hypothetical protein
MWWKLGALGLFGVAYVALLFLPIAPVDITVEMPRARSTGRNVEWITVDQVIAFATVVGVAIAAIPLVVLGWLARRVVRFHTKGSEPPNEGR